MTSEFIAATKLIRQLDDAFPGTQSLIVGGAVRDFLIDAPIVDADIATNVPFDELSAKFDLRDITKNTVNAQPVSVIHFEGFAFEIAAFRSDSFGIEGRANNAPVIAKSFAEDAARRDITINAMGIDSNNQLLDPTGHGRQDILNHVIRAVGDPAMRFREDATRILRVFRFAAKFNFDIDADTLEAAKANKGRLLDRRQIAPESVAKELFKAAKDGPTLMRFIMLLQDAGILHDHLPEFTALEGFTHDPQHHPEAGGSVIGHILECLRVSESSDPVVNLAILFHDLGKAVTRGVKDNGHSNYHGHEEAGVPITQAIFDRLRFSDLSAEDKDAILFAVDRHMLIHKLGELTTKKLVQLVHNPGWHLLKQVGFADEASRHIDGFDRSEFDNKIFLAEAKVSRIAANRDDLRLKVKAFVDGHKVLSWFPDVQENITLLTPILAGCADFILEQLDQGRTPSENEIQDEIQAIIDSQ